MLTGRIIFDTRMEQPFIRDILDLLPEKYGRAYDKLTHFERVNLCEIRIRADRPCSFTVGNKNIPMRCDGENIILSSASEIEDILERLCDGSVYSFSDMIGEGYIPYKGTRIGVCGNGGSVDGKYDGQRKITSVSIRIPGEIVNAADSVLEYINANGVGNTMGILAISPPNCGKTTFLRALARGLSDVTLSHTPKRVCIIDERDELYNDRMMKNCFCDVIKGVPKVRALEMAVRTMSPEVIVVDEIGNEREAELIGKAYSGGIYVAASVHGNDTNNMTASEAVKRIIGKGVFGTAYVMKDNAAYSPGKIIPLGRNGTLPR